MNPARALPADELRGQVRDYLAESSPPREVRRLMQTTEGYDRTVWRELVERFGGPGLLIPRCRGGRGGTWADLAVVLEELGRAMVCAPFLSGVVATAAVLSSGDADAHDELLAAIASGQVLATVTTTEGGRVRESAAGALVASPSGGGAYVLDGHQAFVLDGHIAELVFVAARTANGLSLFTVAGDAEGLTRTPTPTMDQTRRLARLDLSATPGRLVGTEGDGGRLLRRMLELGAVALAAEQVGGAQRCLEMAVDHARTRYQFGRPIGSFQAVKHRCADMLVAVESARSAAEHAARQAEGTGPSGDGDEALTMAASLAKVYCSEAYFRVAADNIQLHGALGFSWDHDAHLYLKRATSSMLLFGDPFRHRRLLAHGINL